jgi:hypothetical protein
MAYEPVCVGKNPTIVCNKYYKTLLDAINHIEEHMIIKLNKGVYNERIKITYILFYRRKKDIKLQAT